MSDDEGGHRRAGTTTVTVAVPGLHGTVSPFDGSQEDRIEYAERLDSYFVANDITDVAKRRAILLNAVGPTTYRLIKTLCLPGKPKDHSDTFEELVEKVKTHFNPKPSPIIKRYEFNTRKQRPGETVAEYVAALPKIAEHCEYGDILNDMLQDRLVCGIADKRVQNRYLREAKLTYTEARDMALAAETADKDSKKLHLENDDSGAAVPPVSLSSHKEGTIAHVDKPIDKSKVSRARSGRGSSQQRASQSGGRNTTCYRYGGKHEASQCKYKDYECHYCRKKGHLASVCRKKKRDSRTQPEQTRQVVADSSGEEEYTMYHIGSKATKPLIVGVKLNGIVTAMEVDTGVSVSIMSEENFKSLRDRGTVLSQLHAKLFTYTGEQIPVVGAAEVWAEHNGQVVKLPLIVTGGTGPTLLGRNWLSLLQLNWKEIFIIHTCKSLFDVLDSYSDVFAEGLGTVQGVTAAIHVDPTATPRFHKARPLPYMLKTKVEKELEHLEQQGVIEPIQFSDWAAPIVPVIKSDGSVRICGDYKVTVNQAAKVDQYPIPRIDDLFASLSGGKKFTKLDLSHAYQQVQLDEASRQYVTINTHKGLFQYNKLPFGVSSTPSIFQRIMETLLQGIPGVCIYIDDILITGRTDKEHLEHLAEVLRRLKEAGMRLKMGKCAYLLPSVEYLGHTISAEGLRTADSKVEAIVNAPAPRNVSELRSFLGLVNYYAKFLPNLTTTLSPLYALLRKHQKWSWGRSQAKAFDEVKSLLKSSRVLVHFDDTLPVILSCDASPYGVGAVLSHLMPNGDERPISFASRILTETEKKYSQLEKEALAIIFGVCKFHQYIYGRKFELKTDHKPLMYIFNEKKSIPAMASGRIQRWALTLGAYSYTIRFQKGSENTTADAVSRLPLPVTRAEPPKLAEVVHLMEYLDTSPVTSSQIRLWTDQDPILAKIKGWILTGWPENSPDDEKLRAYVNRKSELSVENGCLLWGNRVIVPEKGRKRVVAMLHQAHPGITRMKGLARCYVWWPGIDKEMELCVKSCEACQVNQKAPPNVPLHPWSWPSKPWSRVHIDYAGPFMGKMFLLVIDAYTKWLDVHVTSTSTSTVTIELLRKSFSTYGLPEVVVSDNATNFTSDEFEAFLRANGVKHVRTPPYHPASNGLVERAVQTLKSGLKKLKAGSVETKVSRFLFAYRVTPHTSTGLSPGELMFGRRMRTALDNLRPDLEKKVRQGQEQQKRAHDKGARPRDFSIGDLVYARNYGPGVMWLPGEIVSSLGSTMYEVQLADGRKVQKHADQLRSRIPVVPATDNAEEETDSDIDDFDARIPNSDNTTPAKPGNSDNVNSAQPSTLNASEGSETPQETNTNTPEGETVEQSSDPPELR